MASDYDEAASQPPVIFDDALQREILALAHTICEEERWQLEAAAFDPTHTHLVPSWVGFLPWEKVDQRLKNLLALKLNRRHDTLGKRWFVRGRSAPRRVRTTSHFRYLLDTYLPDHSGIFWKRGMPLPLID